MKEKLRFRIVHLDFHWNNFVGVTIEILCGNLHLAEFYTSLPKEDYDFLRKNGIEAAYPNIHEEFAYLLDNVQDYYFDVELDEDIAKLDLDSVK